jgi:hypothetical protein
VQARDAEGIEAGFSLGVLGVREHIQGLVEEYLLALPPCDSMLRPVLLAIGIIPVEAVEFPEKLHR